MNPPLVRVFYKTLDDYDVLEGDLPETFTEFQNKCLEKFNERDPKNFLFQVEFIDNGPINLDFHRYDEIKKKKKIDEIIEFSIINKVLEEALKKKVQLTNEDYSIALLEGQGNIKIPYWKSEYTFIIHIVNNGRKRIENGNLAWDRESELASFDYPIKSLESTEKRVINIKCQGINKRVKPENVGETRKLIFILTIGDKKIPKSKIEINAKIISETEGENKE